MKLNRRELRILVLAVAGWFVVPANAELQFMPVEKPVCVFAGDARSVSVVFSNSASEMFDVEIRTRIFQASSTTVAPVSEAAWKKLQVLPGQTVLDTARLNFPAVKAETQFFVQWLAESNRVLGTTEVWVYPTNQLAELKPLLGEAVLGVLDPDNELKPLLRHSDVKFVDLGESALEVFHGRLAILGPFRPGSQWPEDAARRVRTMAKNGVAVLWFQPPPSLREKLQPTFYAIASGTNSIVAAQSCLIAGLSEQPQSQLHLLRLCQLALNPKPPALPEPGPQP